MPTRLLRDWTDSLRFEGISADAERLFTRLLMKADDYGRFHADPRLIRGACFPLAENLPATTIAGWIEELGTRNLIVCYEVGSRKFLAIPNFGQRLKQSRPKFPPLPGKPDEWLPVSNEFPESAGSSAQVPGTSTQVPGTSRNFPSDSDTDTDTDTDTNTTPPSPQGGDGVGELALEAEPAKEPQMAKPDPLEVPENLKTPAFMNAWAQWQTFRRGLGKKPKDWVMMFRAQLDHLAKFPVEVATESISKSIRNNWQGLFPENAHQRNGSNNLGNGASRHRAELPENTRVALASGSSELPPVDD